MKYETVCVCVWWNLSNQDTNGAEERVIVSEVSSFQRLKYMQEWYLGWEKVSWCPYRGVPLCNTYKASTQEWYILGVGKGVLFREVSSIQGCPHRGVPLYIHTQVLQ